MIYGEVSGKIQDKIEVAWYWQWQYYTNLPYLSYLPLYNNQPGPHCYTTVWILLQLMVTLPIIIHYNLQIWYNMEICPPDTKCILSGVLEFWKFQLLVNAIDNNIYIYGRRNRRILISCFGIYSSRFES